MSISPFNPGPVTAGGEGRRARLVLAIAAIGIAATLLAYAISPGVRHVVGRAAHSVGHVLDRDRNEHKALPSGRPPARTTTAPARTTTAPARTTTAPGG